jgi:hypothetical protein
MARLASEAKMGFYPTPERSLREITQWIEIEGGYGYTQSNSQNRFTFHLLDPCCGNGKALQNVVGYQYKASKWGIELDIERAMEASNNLDTVIQCSIFDARVNPLGSMGLLWLNPPYSTEDRERVEVKFLKHSMKWLVTDGVLIFIVPENILDRRNLDWIGQHFYDIRVLRLHRKDYPQFRQIVLIGKKRDKRAEDSEIVPSLEYPHIEDVEPKSYSVPPTDGPEVFQGGDTVTNEEIQKNYPRLLEEIRRITGFEDGVEAISPLFPLRKGHLVALITAGVLDGKIQTADDDFILVKGFSERVSHTRIEDNKEITRNTYAIGIRVMEKGGRWYDIR